MTSVELPCLPREFITHLAGSPSTTPTRDVLKPFLDYEKKLRQSFAMDKEVADSISASPLQNLVPIYAGKEQQVRQRHVDRKISNPDKYIIKLPDDEIGVDGELAISGSLEDYRRNFEGFTYSMSNECLILLLIFKMISNGWTGIFRDLGNSLLKGCTWILLTLLDWSNLVVAGSAALHPLLSYQYAPNTSRITIEYPLEAYYRCVWLFFVLNIAQETD